MPTPNEPFESVVLKAFAIGRGTVLVLDDALRGRIKTGDQVLVAMVDGTAREIHVDGVEFLLEAGGRSRLALVVTDVDPSNVLLGAPVTTP